MTDSPGPGKLSKLGRLFGKSQTNLPTVSQQSVNSKSKSPAVGGEKQTQHSNLNETTSSTLSTASDIESPPPHPNEEYDDVSPLPLKQPQPRQPHIPSPLAQNSQQPAPAAAALYQVDESSPKIATRAGSQSPNTPGRASPNVSRSSSRKMTRQPSLSVKNNSTTSLNSSQQQNQSRFVMLENGLHEHHLRAMRRHESFPICAVPDMAMQLSSSTQLQQQQQQQQQQAGPNKPPTLFSNLVTQVKNHTSPYHQPGTISEISNAKVAEVGAGDGAVSAAAAAAGPDCRSFVEKYGRCQEVIGRGSFGVVRISHKKLDPASSSVIAATPGTNGQEKLYAVKEFKKKPNENEKKYNRRLTSEFCISSSLKHLNIIDTLDLLKDAKGEYCEVMEFCTGGDLYTLIIASGKLEYAEADCFFKQLIRGVNYMHDMGVAHRDLKPENILLTQNGVLKITDFGNSECFKMAWEEEVQFSDGVCGSSPYIAPEEFTQDSFDPRCVDIWACGVIYMAMRTGRQLWKLADPKKDEFFEEYLIKRKEATGYEPIESLKRARCRNVIYSILDPKPERRITGKQILNSEWGREIKVCNAGEGIAEVAAV
ncbi:SAT4 [Candida theae]|uniref:non-specific serine/threonine protein kinase n=1 Tax=Candida theae TaxID=1198502 RepID=A0AAD5BG46_9ASCO|nr:SAT4 [Candida theae]KAI5958895.1 SAT4 [Candida theae]